MNHRNSEVKIENPSVWKQILLLLLLFLAFFFVLVGFGRAQKDLSGHLEAKRDALKQIYENIEAARKGRIRLAALKKRARFLTRLFLVCTLFAVNWCYLYHYQSELQTWPQRLGAVTDLNAIFLIALSSLVFLVHGSFLNLKGLLDDVQNRIIRRFYHKREAVIEAMLKTNLEDREAIRKEIEETEKAIKENEALMTELELPLYDNFSKK